MHRPSSPTVRARRLAALRRCPAAGGRTSRARRWHVLRRELVPWATALTALTAAIGLLFSGMVAMSSVDASRKELERDRRRQAGRVGYWTQDAAGDSETVIIANRSLDPVTRVDLWFHAPDAGVDTYEWVFVGFDAIPPCTRLVFAPRTIDDYLQGRFGIEPGGAPIRAIQFYDGDGRWWIRDIDGLRPGEHERSADEDERVDGEDVGAPPARQEPAEHCET
ncbi:hypothetical protein LG634_06035 [Streptomyces bambusae]|uniref:hypothetical protein n=1 Tax=Streptomyces bambusae TaxID=1550616 RepID=UPI001CFC840C|nr:hypothetical protein [Streptomyces bambusae]MCB5164393.1 hypothetical protein [Streptomyces bambusae]